MKIVFLGDTGCGKTSIIKDKLNGRFEHIYNLNAIVDFYNIKSQNVNLNIYDTPSQMKFRETIPFILRHVNVFVIAYDFTQTDVNSYLNEWIQFIDNTSNKNPEIFSVCNKIDLVWKHYAELEPDNECIEYGKLFAEEYNYHFIATSAKYAFGIDQLFDEISQTPLHPE